MSIETFGNWLYETPISTSIRDITGLSPRCRASTSWRSRSSSDRRSCPTCDWRGCWRRTRHQPPWCAATCLDVGALVVLLLTGIVMLVAEPGRTLTNTVFWIKMALVLSAFALTMAFRKPLLDPQFRIDHAHWRAAVKPAAQASLAIWIAVVFCGRWIAYT